MTATVWRVVYDLSGITMRSDWSVHHDMIRQFADEFAVNMPGTNVRIESGEVQDVEVIGTQSLRTDPEDVDAEDDITAPYDVEPDYGPAEDHSLHGEGNDETPPGLLKLADMSDEELRDLKHRLKHRLEDSNE